MIVGDVGQDEQEEVDFIPAPTGSRRQLRLERLAGACAATSPGSAPGAVAPTLTVSHSSGYCAIIGGYVVRDRSLPGLDGRYLFGDFCRPQIESVKLRRGHASDLRATGLQVSTLSSMGQDASGHIYLTSLDGPVHRIYPAGAEMRASERRQHVPKMTETEWKDFITQGTRTGKLATTRKDGRPHVVPIWVVLACDELVFNTGESTG